MTELEDVQDVQTAHFLFTVELGFVEALRLQEFDALATDFEHLFARTEFEGFGLAGLDASRDLAFFESVEAERALVDLAVRVAETRHVERTGALAVRATVALFRIERDDAVVVLLQSTRRADRHAARVRAVEARTTADRPVNGLKLVVGRLLVKGHDEAGVAAEVARPLERTGELVVVQAHLRGQHVPLLARHLAALATRAVRGVEEDRYFFVLFRHVVLLALTRPFQG